MANMAAPQGQATLEDLEALGTSEPLGGLKLWLEVLLHVQRYGTPFLLVGRGQRNMWRPIQGQEALRRAEAHGLILALYVCCVVAKSLAFSDLGITFSNTNS